MKENLSVVSDGIRTNIYAGQGNMTAGTDGQTIDAMSLERINRLIEALKDESYHPKPSRRTYGNL